MEDHAGPEPRRAAQAGALGSRAARRRGRAAPARRRPARPFEAPKPGGKLIVGIGQTFEDINVLTAFGYRWGQLMAYAMYDTLVKYDNQGKAVPLLATKWSTPNPKTTIVTIRKGVKFHDGTPMRVEDVVWSLNRINDPVKPASNNFLALPKDIWDKAEKINDSTLPDHDEEADPDGRELALLVHHAGERRHPEAGRASSRSAPARSSTRTSSRATGSS